MTITLEKTQGLIAGDGELPVKLAQSAQKSGFDVVAISLSPDNRKQLEKYCKKVYSFGPAEIIKIEEKLIEEGVKQLSFIGKVHKALLLKNPKLDSKALELIKSMEKLNDDAVMLSIVNELEKIGITVLDQTIFIKNLMIPKGVLTETQPTKEEQDDISYGFGLAKEMGKLDIGQSVVIKNKMILAVEAIEGTDKCVQRGCKLARGGAIVVKVSKPSQDKRFDIPTVGLKTIKNLKRYGGKILAVEAGETIIVEQKELIKFANRHKIVVVAV